MLPYGVTRPQWINPFSAEARIIQKNQIKTMTADALAPYVARTSTAMVFIVENIQSFISNGHPMVFYHLDDSV